MAGIAEARRAAHDVVESTPESAWPMGVYENGWNAKQILCHLALTSYVPAFLIGLASQPAGSELSNVPGDIDDFNEQQVAIRIENPVTEILAEIDRNYELASKLVEATPDGTIAKHIRTPWGSEGSLGEKILVEDLREHVAVHLADISAVAS